MGDETKLWLLRGMIWWIDFQILATVLLCITCFLNLVVGQPSRRLALAWFATIGLVLLALGSLVPVQYRVAIDIWQPDLNDSFFLNIVAVFSVGYVISVCALATWQSLGFVAAKRIMKNSRRFLCDQHALNVSGLQVRRSENIQQPIAIGLFRPAVIVPSGFLDNAPQEELNAVVNHEISHVQRGDLWLIGFIRCLAFLLFLNPVFWLLKRQVRRDQELLSDEQASRFWEPVSYAELLVRMTRSLPAPARFSCNLVSFTQPNLLKLRIHQLLHRETPVDLQPPRWWSIVSYLSVTCCVLLLSQITFFAMQQTERDATRHSALEFGASEFGASEFGPVEFGEFEIQSLESVALGPESEMVYLSHGVTLQLLGLREHPCGGAAIWNADGSLPDGSFDCGSDRPAATPIEIVVRIDNPQQIPFELNVQDSNVRRLDHDAAITLEPSQQIYAISIPEQLDKHDFRFSIALGDWHTKFQSSTSHGKYVLSECNDVEGFRFVSIQHPQSPHEDLRLVAFDECGTAWHPALHAGIEVEPFAKEVSARFPDESTTLLQEFQLQSRPKHWIDLNNVSLVPGHLTEFYAESCGVNPAIESMKTNL